MDTFTTTAGHVTEILTLVSVLTLLAIPVYFEKRKQNNAPRPSGATKV